MEIRKLQPGEQPPMELLTAADPSPQKIEGYLQRGDCYVAVSSGEVAGVYVLIPTRPDTVELVNVAVAEEHQGKGLGKRLVTEAVSAAREAGCTTIELGTGNSSINQLALYQKCGFRITGVDIDYFTRHYAEPIVENGMLCRDMIRLSQDL